LSEAKAVKEPVSIVIPKAKITEFCERWKITELALFGSAVRADFRSDSDVDVLVTFSPDVKWSLFDHVDMQDELARILGRPVDLVSRRGIERSRNASRRRAILESARVVHAA
jgi:predicted nucleotidyltransferase